MTQDVTVAPVTRIPECDFCEGPQKKPAAYDAVTVYGPWANMCEKHFRQHGKGTLGLGLGQKYVQI
jgi:hypothetical protein